MPKIIKDGAVSDDQWLPVDPSLASPESGRICSLDQWLTLEAFQNSAVQLEADEPPAPLLEKLDQIALVVIHFDNFMDGRGFSYGRELREKGFTGELRASGAVIRDQLAYLSRLGFNAFAPDDDSGLEDSLASLSDFSVFYQASINEPQPLFRRR